MVNFEYLPYYFVARIKDLSCIVEMISSSVNWQSYTIAYVMEGDYVKFLTIRPGITGPASIKYSRGEMALSLSKNWEEDYVKRFYQKILNFLHIIWIIIIFLLSKHNL